MSTGSIARQHSIQCVHYLRRSFTKDDSGKTLTVGTIPAGSLILKPLSGVAVTEVFNAGTSNVLDIGPSTDSDLWATDLALGTLAFVPLDEAVTNLVDADTTVVIAPALTGTAATTGKGVAVIAYIPNNDQ